MAPLTRREFIAAAAAMGATWACAGPRALRSRSRWVERRDLFAEGVASGDPGPDSILLWTRASAGGSEASIPLTVEVAEDPGFERVVATAPTIALLAADHTCRVLVTGLRPAATGSRLVFTYVRRDFIDGTNLYGSPTLHRRVCAGVNKLWHFGLQPDEVADFLAEYGWRLIEQAGPEQFLQRYVEPTGRHLGASDLEWSVYAEKL